ncbi:hypothetical protein OG753_40130 [Streptomyces sp. NBC_00029]
MTTDPAKAREWLEDWTDVSGGEGLSWIRFGVPLTAVWPSW